ncbi:DUF4893 domain-containing protein [Phragmitibacter flavus]|nr:DUF4893 domain-containing protein [Phragmitibacter flavus]
MILPRHHHLLCIFFSILLLATQPLSASDSPIEALKNTLRPQHQNVMDDWEAKAQKILQTLEAKDIDQESIETIAAIRKLLDQPRQPAPESKALIGNWRVRSLQAGGLGAYAYPFFKCTITAEARALVFHKPTGSQRKHGILARDNNTHYLFVGAAYYGYENKVRSYSAHLDAPTEEDLQRDTIGHLYLIGKNHLLMVFSPDQGRLEINELKK